MALFDDDDELVIPGLDPDEDDDDSDDGWDEDEGDDE